jgi:imidazole glycerol-phosphate synthase subunit HisH
MNLVQVTVVDYGIGNLFSVCRALEHCSAEVTLTSDPALIQTAPRLVLPGVGAFADGMQGLRDRGLIEPILHYAASGRPLLGICLGMQMLATASEEFGKHRGLGLIPGRVVAIPDHTTSGQPHKIPHIGWNGLLAPAGVSWNETLLGDTSEGTAVYLVHSYAVTPDDPAHRLADCVYGGHRICAAIRRDNIVGCQFHPEKSGEVGLRILRRFLQDPAVTASHS